MTTQATVETAKGGPNAEQIAKYLQTHPGFFDERPELLASLRLPHGSGNAVSLIERQVQVLREQNATLRSRLVELVNVARDNDRLSEQMHQLTLDLLRADSLPPLLDVLEDHLRNEFEADAVALRLTGLDEARQRETGAAPMVIDDAAQQLFPNALGDGKPQCGRLKQQQLQFLFGSAAQDIESAVVIPLGKRGSEGLLAIGSREVDRFNPGMGTLFLSHLAELLVLLLRHHLSAWRRG
ncbi:MAG: DUF484 family protein [Gammaproteobacteria bacterium]|jgi:uncharacterized protein YigA (DUF484 family)